MFSAKFWICLFETSDYIEQSIKRKIEAVGVPLKDWDIRINYGIKTGFNEAFIIDGVKREELIAADPKSAEIIRPILRGKDIKRYSYSFADLWLINTHNGIREQHIPPIDVNKYPAIKAHLDKFYPSLARRQDKGVTPYNLRNCAYTDDFSKQKIIYPDIMRLPRNSALVDQYPYLYFDRDGFFAEATNFILTGDNADLVFLFLISEIGFYCFSKFYTGPQFDNTGFRYKKEYISNLYIPMFNTTYTEIIRNKFTKIDNFDGKSIASIDYMMDNILQNVIGLNENEICIIKNYKKSLL
jgi:hypothetical protein